MQQAAHQALYFSEQLTPHPAAYGAGTTSHAGPSSSSWFVPAGPFNKQLGPALDSCGRSHSGSSAFSNDPCLEPAVLNDWQQEAAAGTLPYLQQQFMQQQQAQRLDISPGHSCQSNYLDVQLQQMFQGQDSQQQQHMQFAHQQQQQDPAEPGSWHEVMQDPALKQAASRICNDQLGFDLDQQQQQQQLDSSMLLGVTGSGDLLRPNAAAAAAAGYSPDASGMHSGSGCHTSPSLQAAGEEASGSAAADGADGAECSGSKPVLPKASLKVACGDMIGTLLVHRARIVINEGTGNEKEVSPTEFERLGGRSATKKWKQSIRLVNEDGELGRPVGEWYVMQGLEQPKKPREPKDAALLGSNNSAARSSSPPPDRSSKHGTAAKAAAAPVHKRPVRAAARNVERHFAAEAASSPELSPTLTHTRAAGRRGGRGAARAAAAAAAAAAMASPPVLLEDAGSGTAESPDVPVDAAAAAGGGMLMHEQASWSLQQQQMLMHGEMLSRAPSLSMHSTAAAAAAAAAEEAAISDATAAALDAAAQGDYQLPPGAAAAAAALPSVSSNGGMLLVAVPVAQPLPGDASQAVIEMTAYLEGRRGSPPWRLLPLSQRPLVGRYLVPLRQLFVLVMRAGGYVRIKDDLLLWQDLASQLGLPAWPCTDVPDPLRALQQVYRDYLLRFEGRFSLPEQPAGAAAAAAAAGVHQSPSLSTATQYPGGQQQQQQQMGGMNVAMMPGGQSYAMSSGSGMQQQQQQQGGLLQLQVSGECLAPAAAAAADNNNFNNSLMQPGQQRLQGQFSLTAGMVLDDTLSGDLFDLLTDLIPDNDGVLPAASSNGMQQQQQPVQMPVAAAEQQPQQQQGLNASLQRQHPEMSLVQQRHRLQQLQVQLQQQQSLAAEVQLGAAAARAKRPPPLIRCGDSDVVSLMDQMEVNRLLRDYEQQQQQQQAPAQQQQHPALRQQHQSPMRQQLQQQQGAAAGVPPRPAASQLAAAITGAVDRAQSKDLQVLMQSYWQRQGGQQQQQQQQRSAASGLQQQQQAGQAGQEFEPPLEPQAADEEMSGMLEALQLAADGQPLTGQQQQRSAAAAGHSEQLLLAPKDDSGSAEGRDGAWAGHLMPASANLLAQGSVGAHLVGLMPQTGVQNSSSNGGRSNGSEHGQRGSILPPPSSQAMPAPPPRPSSAAAAAAGAGSSLNNVNNKYQQQQQQGGAELQAFEGGLLRLTTPNSALIGSVLDSPSMRNVGGVGAGASWMDISEQMLPVRTLSNDLRSMTVELTGAADGQCGPNADDLAAVLQMW